MAADPIGPTVAELGSTNVQQLTKTNMMDECREIYLSVVIPAYNEEHRIGPTLRRVPNLNFSPIEKIKAALRGIKVVSSISYAKGEERPYGNRVYNRTNGISATGAAPSDREI